MMASNFHIENATVIGLHSHRLSQKDYVNTLQNNYSKLLISCYGPKSNYALIRNAADRDIITSSSSLLIQNLAFFHPSFKYINALISAQHKTFGVHGLFVGLTCSTLLYKSLQLEDEIQSSIITRLSNWIVEKVLEHLNEKPTSLVLKLDFGSFDHNLAIVKSIVCSKSSILSSEEIQHLSVKIIESHVRTIPHVGSGKFGNVHISELIGTSTLNTRMVEGVLFRHSDYTIEDLENIVGKIPIGNIKIVLFNVPLSAESCLTEGIEWSGVDTFNTFLLDKLKDTLKRKGVFIIVNQKFMHQSLIFDLRKEGFLVLDRLGTSHTESLLKISGCKAIASVSNLDYDINDCTVGVLSSVQAVTIEEKCFINLKGEELCQNLTLFLTGINEQVVTYMQECIETLRKENISFISEEFDVSSGKVEKVLHAFVSTFISLSTIPSGGKTRNIYNYGRDSTYNHLWALSEASDYETFNYKNRDQVYDRCICGLLNKADVRKWIPLAVEDKSDQLKVFKTPKCSLLFKRGCIIDNYRAKVNAIRLAFEGFLQLYSVGNCIFDK